MGQEGRTHSRRCSVLVTDDSLNEWHQVVPARLLVRAEVADHLINYLIHAFSLAIRLGMVRSRQSLFNLQEPVDI